MEFYYDEVDNNVLVIRADGGLNSETVGQFLGEIEQLVDAGLKKIIVDCEHVQFISSAGLAALMRLHKKMRTHGGDVKVASVHSLIMQVLEVTHLSSVFDVYPDVNAARLAFREA